MKILVGEFITESNANVPQKCEISNYKMLFGDDCIQALHVADVFEQAGFELIPSVVADAGAAGVIKKDTFDYIESCFVRTVKEHIHEIDGMFLMLHGASEVEGIGSGDHHILAEIRKVVGPYLPIFVVCDPHGNLCKEYAEATTLIRSYRESPHTDSIATMRKVAVSNSSAISSGVGSRPRSCRSCLDTRINLLIVSTICTGIRIVRA